MKKVETMRRIGALAVAGMLTMGLAACGTNNEGENQCAADELLAESSSLPQACYKTCTSDNECLRSEQCKSFGENSICVPSAPLVCDNPPDDFCEGSVSVTHDAMGDGSSGTCDYNPTRTDCETMDMACNQATGKCDGPSVASLCGTYCDLFFGQCAADTCSSVNAGDLTMRRDACLNGGTIGNQTFPSCLTEYNTNANLRTSVNNGQTAMCMADDVLRTLCQIYGGMACGCADPTVGGACIADSDCELGFLEGGCIDEATSMGDFPGGYCSVLGCDAGSTMAGAGSRGDATGCGVENLCLNQNSQQGVVGVCFEGCTQTSDCARAPADLMDPMSPGYSCSIIGTFNDGSAAGICQPACATNDDCEGQNGMPGGFCNADRSCEPPCDPMDAMACGDAFTCVERGINMGTMSTGSCEFGTGM